MKLPYEDGNTLDSTVYEHTTPHNLFITTLPQPYFVKD
jgi:hypothetical protein